MKSKLLIYSLLFGCAFLQTPSPAQTSSTNAAAIARNRNVITRFFANYGLIGDWQNFQDQQTKLLSPSLMTFFSANGSVKTYEAPAGYFASLGDWSKMFATGSDFRTEIVRVESKRVIVRLHGTLKLTSPIQGYNELKDNQHFWTEIFGISADGKINKLEVRMNLFHRP